MTQLTQDQASRLGKAIDARERELRGGLRDELERSGNERYGDLAGAVHDQGDESVANELIDLGNSFVQRHVLELRALEDARRRLADGSIGECAECGGDIGFERLLANPTAIRCVACQETFERTHAHAARPRL